METFNALQERKEAAEEAKDMVEEYKEVDKSKAVQKAKWGVQKRDHEKLQDNVKTACCILI